MPSALDKLKAIRGTAQEKLARIRGEEPPTRLLDEQGIDAAEVRRRAAADEPIVQTGLRPATGAQEIGADVAAGVTGVAGGMMGLGGLAVDAARDWATGGLLGRLVRGEGAKPDLAATEMAGRATDKVRSATRGVFGIDENVATEGDEAITEFLGDVVAPGPEVVGALRKLKALRAAKGGKVITEGADAAARATLHQPAQAEIVGDVTPPSGAVAGVEQPNLSLRQSEEAWRDLTPEQKQQSLEAIRFNEKPVVKVPEDVTLPNEVNDLKPHQAHLMAQRIAAENGWNIPQGSGIKAQKPLKAWQVDNTVPMRPTDQEDAFAAMHDAVDSGTPTSEAIGRYYDEADRALGLDRTDPSIDTRVFTGKDWNNATPEEIEGEIARLMTLEQRALKASDNMPTPEIEQLNRQMDALTDIANRNRSDMPSQGGDVVPFRAPAADDVDRLMDDIPEVQGERGLAEPLSDEESIQIFGAPKEPAAPPPGKPPGGDSGFHSRDWASRELGGGTPPPTTAPPGSRGPGDLPPAKPERVLETPETLWQVVKNRYVTEGLTALRKSGPVGAEIADKLFKATRRFAQMAVEPIEALRAVRSLSKQQKEQFVDLLDGKITADQVTPNVRTLAAAHRRFLDQFGEAAEQHGLMIQISDGTWVPFKRRPDYFPHLKKDDPDGSVFAGSDELPTGARVGSLEHAREGDMDFLRDPVQALAAYYSGAARKIAEVEQFGSEMTKAVDRYVRAASKGGEKSEFIRDALQQSLGGGPRPLHAVQGAVGDAMNVQVVTKLMTAVIGNATQTVYTYTKAGLPNTAGAIFDFVRGTLGDREVLSEAIRSGAPIEGMINDLLAGKQGRWSALLARGTLRATGFTGVEHANRIIAAGAGIRTAEDLARVASGKAILPWFGTEKAKARALGELEKMGIDTAKFQKTGKLSEQDRLNAGFWMSHRTQFGTRPEDMPFGWSASPQARLVTQFKGFSFKAAKAIKDEVVTPALKGNPGPLLRFAAGAGVLGGLSETARDILFNKDDWKEYRDGAITDREYLKRKVINGILAVSMANTVASIYKAGEYGVRGLEDWLIGPTLSDMRRQADVVEKMQVFPAIKESIQTRSTGPIASVGEAAVEDVMHGEGPITRDINKTVPATRALTNRGLSPAELTRVLQERQ